MAFDHIGAVLGTFATSHEYKIAAAGFLFSKWFQDAFNNKDRNEEGFESCITGEFVKIEK